MPGPYRYSSAVLPDDGVESPRADDPQLHYRPTTRPGARVPHARLERNGQAASSLDLAGGLRFAVLTGSGGEGWVPAAAEATAAAGVPVDVHVIGAYEGLVDPYGEWAARREVETTGCVLVRPDQHVAWRAQRFGAESSAELTAAVRQAVGWLA